MVIGFCRCGAFFVKMGWFSGWVKGITLPEKVNFKGNWESLPVQCNECVKKTQANYTVNQLPDEILPEFTKFVLGVQASEK